MNPNKILRNSENIILAAEGTSIKIDHDVLDLITYMKNFDAENGIDQYSHNM